MGSGLRSSPRTAETFVAESNRSGCRHRRYRSDHRDLGDARKFAPPRYIRANRGPVGLLFIRFLQRRGSQDPCPPRPLARAHLDAGISVGFLAGSESAVESCGRAFHIRAVDIPVRVLDDLCPGTVLTLFPGPAVP